ncbi:MAG: DMT family transporter [Spirochaetota bacterium]
MKSLTRSHLPSIVLLSFFFGSNLVVSRFALGQFHPIVFTALRAPIAAILALVWARIRQGSFPSGSHVWKHGAVVGVFATAAPMICFISALQYQSAGVTALFITLTPISSMIFAHLRLPDDRLTRWKVVGAIISFAGVGLLVVTGETGLQETQWAGFLLVLVGVASNGFGIVHVRKYLHDASSLDIAAVRLTTAAAIAITISAFIGFDFTAVRVSGVLALVYGAVPGTLLGFILYSYVVARFGATKGTQVEYLVPVFATVTGRLFLDERITGVMITGMVVVFAGIAVATLPHRRRDGGATRVPTARREKHLPR